MNSSTRSRYAKAWGEMIRRRRQLIEELTGDDLSQAELARQLGVASVTVWRWEHGRAAPGPEMQAGLIRILKIPGDELRALISLADDDGEAVA